MKADGVTPTRGAGVGAVPGAADGPGASRGAGGLSEEERRRIAGQFEAMFLRELWHAMESSLGKEGSGLFGGPYGAIVDTEWSEWLASTPLGNLGPGITDAIMKALDRGDLPASGDGSIAAIAAGRRSMDLLTAVRSYGSAAAATAPPAVAIPRTGPGGGTAFDPVSRRVLGHDEAIRVAASENELDANLLRAIVHQESGGRPGVRSAKGAMGLMQLMPDTARAVGVEHPFEARENIRGGARYLRRLLDRFRGDEEKALAAYNAGPGAVDRAGGIPAFRETRAYVPRVLELRERYRMSIHQPEAPMDGTEEP